MGRSSGAGHRNQRPSNLRFSPAIALVCIITMRKMLMKADRRQFNLGLTTALLSLGAAPQLRAQKSEDPSLSQSGAAASSATRPPYFFKNPTFETIFLTSLGRAYHSA